MTEPTKSNIAGFSEKHTKASHERQKSRSGAVSIDAELPDGTAYEKHMYDRDRVRTAFESGEDLFEGAEIFNTQLVAALTNKAIDLGLSSKDVHDVLLEVEKTVYAKADVEVRADYAERKKSGNIISRMFTGAMLGLQESLANINQGQFKEIERRKIEIIKAANNAQTLIEAAVERKALEVKLRQYEELSGGANGRLHKLTREVSKGQVSVEDLEKNPEYIEAVTELSKNIDIPDNYEYEPGKFIDASDPYVKQGIQAHMAFLMRSEIAQLAVARSLDSLSTDVYDDRRDGAVKKFIKRLKTSGAVWGAVTRTGVRIGVAAVGVTMLPPAGAAIAAAIAAGAVAGYARERVNRKKREKQLRLEYSLHGSDDALNTENLSDEEKNEVELQRLVIGSDYITQNINKHVGELQKKPRTIDDVPDADRPAIEELVAKIDAALAGEDLADKTLDDIKQLLRAKNINTQATYFDVAISASALAEVQAGRAKELLKAKIAQMGALTKLVANANIRLLATLERKQAVIDAEDAMLSKTKPNLQDYISFGRENRFQAQKKLLQVLSDARTLLINIEDEIKKDPSMLADDKEALLKTIAKEVTEHKDALHRVIKSADKAIEVNTPSNYIRSMAFGALGGAAAAGLMEYTRYYWLENASGNTAAEEAAGLSTHETVGMRLIPGKEITYKLASGDSVSLKIDANGAVRVFDPTGKQIGEPIRALSDEAISSSLTLEDLPVTIEAKDDVITILGGSDNEVITSFSVTEKLGRVTAEAADTVAALPAKSPMEALFANPQAKEILEGFGISADEVQVNPETGAVSIAENASRYISGTPWRQTRLELLMRVFNDPSLQFSATDTPEQLVARLERATWFVRNKGIDPARALQDALERDVSLIDKTAVPYIRGIEGNPKFTGVKQEWLDLAAAMRSLEQAGFNADNSVGAAIDKSGTLSGTIYGVEMHQGINSLTPEDALGMFDTSTTSALGYAQEAIDYISSYGVDAYDHETMAVIGGAGASGLAALLSPFDKQLYDFTSIKAKLDKGNPDSSSSIVSVDHEAAVMPASQEARDKDMGSGLARWYNRINTLSTDPTYYKSLLQPLSELVLLPEHYDTPPGYSLISARLQTVEGLKDFANTDRGPLLSGKTLNEFMDDLLTQPDSPERNRLMAIATQAKDKLQTVENLTRAADESYQAEFVRLALIDIGAGNNSQLNSELTDLAKDFTTTNDSAEKLGFVQKALDSIGDTQKKIDNLPFTVTTDALTKLSTDLKKVEAEATALHALYSLKDTLSFGASFDWFVAELKAQGLLTNEQLFGAIPYKPTPEGVATIVKIVDAFKTAGITTKAQMTQDPCSIAVASKVVPGVISQNKPRITEIVLNAKAGKDPFSGDDSAPTPPTQPPAGPTQPSANPPAPDTNAQPATAAVSPDTQNPTSPETPEIVELNQSIDNIKAALARREAEVDEYVKTNKQADTLLDINFNELENDITVAIAKVDALWNDPSVSLEDHKKYSIIKRELHRLSMRKLSAEARFQNHQTHLELLAKASAPTEAPSSPAGDTEPEVDMKAVVGNVSQLGLDD